mmetsp:Transcript_44536/g.112212  ORF Transcript_44536/g.112212 Transcript_44536/m.112212 type:complete len:581 (+) Transcript_44536:184-1926(+)
MPSDSEPLLERSVSPSPSGVPVPSTEPMPVTLPEPLLDASPMVELPFVAGAVPNSAGAAAHRTFEDDQQFFPLSDAQYISGGDVVADLSSHGSAFSPAASSHSPASPTIEATLPPSSSSSSSARAHVPKRAKNLLRDAAVAAPDAESGWRVQVRTRPTAWHKQLMRQRARKSTAAEIDVHSDAADDDHNASESSSESDSDTDEEYVDPSAHQRRRRFQAPWRGKGKQDQERAPLLQSPEWLPPTASHRSQHRTRTSRVADPYELEQGYQSAAVHHGYSSRAVPSALSAHLSHASTALSAHQRALQSDASVRRLAGYLVSRKVKLRRLRSDLSTDSRFRLRRYRDVLSVQLLTEQNTHFFVFKTGVVVFWGLFPDEEVNILLQIEPFLVQPDRQNIVEIMEFAIGQPACLIHDRVILPNHNPLHKLAISYAIEHALRIEHFETALEATVEPMHTTADHMARTGEVKPSRHELTRAVGSLFKLRLELNIAAELVTTPTFIWDNARMQPFYNTARSYLEIDDRLQALNNRMELVQEFYTKANQELTVIHSAFLEWIVIILVLVEAIFELITIVIDVFGLHMSH